MFNCIANFTPHPQIASCRSEYDAALRIFAREGGYGAPHVDLGKHPDFPFKTWYKRDYVQIFTDIKAKALPNRETFAQLIKEDLFFIVYFVAGWEDGASSGNHPFIVEQCRMLEEGPDSGTVDVWSREHGKSTCITIGMTVKRIVNNPDCTTAIFSYKKPAAEKFLDSIRKILELPIMVWAFPEILYENPSSQAASWSLQGGIRVKRSNTTRREHTVEAFGLVEGMPTGGHFDHRIYDDVETDDMAQNPDQLLLCYNKLMMSRNLGREGGTEQVIGTYYSHCGVLVKLGDKKDFRGDPQYQLRIFPGTDDGTINGKPVFFSQQYLDGKKTDPGFSTQILCNPTPSHQAKLHFNRFVMVKRKELPEKRHKFVIIDPAGDKDVQSGNKNDRWAMLCIGIEPHMDDLGLSNIYLEDAIVGEMGSAESQGAGCDIYTRNGRITMLGVERVGTDSAWLHIKNALAARGRYLEMKKAGKAGGNMMLLSPANRSKAKKIGDNLEYPLNNAKIHIVDDLDPEVLDWLEQECGKFPFFHVDVLDALSYTYDILADPEFQFPREDRKKPVKKHRHVSPGVA